MVLHLLSRRMLGAGMLLAVSAGSAMAEPAAFSAMPFPAPAVSLDANAIAVRDRLETAVADQILAKSAAEAVAGYYEANNYALAWIEDGVYSDRGMAVMDRIRAADTDGLDPAEYALPPRNVGVYLKASPALQARADLLLTQAVLDYSHDAHSGRVTPTAISANFSYEPHRLDDRAILDSVAAADDPVAVLELYHPQHEGYQALRKALAETRTKAEADEKPQVPAGGLIKPGMSDPRVIVLRARLELPADVEEPEVYDETVVAAVKDFQRSARLGVDGIVGRNTVAALNRGEQSAEDTIIANMERWRWMPEELGDLYVQVNIPRFELDIRKDGEVVHTTRVVVGKVSQQTPIFSDEMEHVVVNPFWNVPASITRNEMLPKLRAGSSLAGYQVYAYSRGRFRAVNPRRVNWNRVNASQVRIKQPPGSRNALGQVKFLFPNKHSVYLHDTPSKSLFDREVRAFSHGCVRVHNPWEFAEALFAYSDDVDGAALRRMVGGGEKWKNLDHKIPVHITYFTAWVDDAGELQLRGDIYGYDQRLTNAFGTS